MLAKNSLEHLLLAVLAINCLIRPAKCNDEVNDTAAEPGKMMRGGEAVFLIHT